jgi:hypothetical protein
MRRAEKTHTPFYAELIGGSRDGEMVAVDPDNPPAELTFSNETYVRSPLPDQYVLRELVT